MKYIKISYIDLSYDLIEYIDTYKFDKLDYFSLFCTLRTINYNKIDENDKKIQDTIQKLHVNDEGFSISSRSIEKKEFEDLLEEWEDEGRVNSPKYTLNLYHFHFDKNGKITKDIWQSNSGFGEFYLDLTYAIKIEELEYEDDYNSNLVYCKNIRPFDEYLFPSEAIKKIYEKYKEYKVYKEWEFSPFEYYLVIEANSLIRDVNYIEQQTDFILKGHAIKSRIWKIQHQLRENGNYTKEHINIFCKYYSIYFNDYEKNIEQRIYEYIDKIVEKVKTTKQEECLYEIPCVCRIRSYQRYLIHEYLRDNPYVTTESRGEEYDRALYIIPKNEK